MLPVPRRGVSVRVAGVALLEVHVRGPVARRACLRSSPIAEQLPSGLALRDRTLPPPPGTLPAVCKSPDEPLPPDRSPGQLFLRLRHLELVARAWFDDCGPFAP